MKKEDEKNYMEMQLINQQIVQIQEQLQLMDRELNELALLSESLGELSKKKGKVETLIPLGGGIFSKGVIENTEKVIASVGSKVAVEKSMEDSKKIVDDQAKIIKENIEKLEANLNQLASYGQTLQQEIQK